MMARRGVAEYDGFMGKVELRVTIDTALVAQAREFTGAGEGCCGLKSAMPARRNERLPAGDLQT